MVEATLKPIIIDNGSGVIKAGMGGEEKPRTVFPNVVGRPKSTSVIPGGEGKSLYLGDEAQKMRGVLDMSYPIIHGVVKNWDDMTAVWEHTIVNELRIEPNECNLMLTEAPMNPKANREMMIDIAFNKFGFKGFYVGIQAVLAMFSTGRTTGIVLDAGDGVTHAVPIFETYSVPHAVTKALMAGRDISAHLQNLLRDIGFNADTTAGFQVIRKIKEDLCYVSMDYKTDINACDTEEWKKANEKAYTLPDGNILMVGKARFLAPEAIFQPKNIGLDYPGVHKLIADAIALCDLDVRKPLWENVILSGGNTMFPNYPERLQAELKNLAPASINVKVVATPERKYAVFLGAAQLANMSAFQTAWITKQEFEEYGASIVHKKCF